MNKKYKKIILASLLVTIMILPLIPKITLAYTITPSKPLGIASQEVTFKDQSVPGQVPDIKSITVTSNYVYIRADLIRSWSIDYANTTITQANTYIFFHIPIDFDANQSTGITYRFVSSSLPYPYSYSIKGIDAILVFKDSQTRGSTIYNQYIFNLTVFVPGVGIKTYNITNITKPIITNKYIKIPLNWSGMEKVMEEATGRSYKGSIHRVYITIPVVGDTQGLLAANLIIGNSITDSLNCNPTGLKPVVNQTIIMNGSLKAWPQQAILCTDNSSLPPGIPQYYNAKAVMIAKDSTYLYYGFLMNGTLPPVVDGICKYKASAGFYLNATHNMSISLQYHFLNTFNLVSITYYPATSVYKVSVGITGSNIPNNLSLPLAEVGIPFSSVRINGSAFNETMLTLYKPSNQLQILDFLDSSTPDKGYTIVPIIIDSSKGLVYRGPQLNTTSMLVSYGGPYNVSFVGMRVFIENVTGDIVVDGGYSGTPFDANRPLITNGRIFYYTFSLYALSGYSLTANVTWPLKVYLTVPPQYKIDKAKIYYYSKSNQSYVLFPSSLMKIYPGNNTIELTYPLSLYQDGDPGIAIVLPGTVGGVIEGGSTAGGWRPSPLTSLVGLLLVVGAAVLIVRRLGGSSRGNPWVRLV